MPTDGNKPVINSPILNNPEITGRISKTTSNTIPVSASNATQLDCSKGDVWAYTPTENTTITPVNLAPGQRITIHIQATGTSRTITFGAPFKTTGTLATGTDNTKSFAVSFTCNVAGDALLEDGRTAAQA